MSNGMPCGWCVTGADCPRHPVTGNEQRPNEVQSEKDEPTEEQRKNGEMHHVLALTRGEAVRVSNEQAMRVVRHALDFVHDIGDCLFCTLEGTDVHAWHEDFCPLRDIDKENPPKKAARRQGTGETP